MAAHHRRPRPGRVPHRAKPWGFAHENPFHLHDCLAGRTRVGVVRHDGRQAVRRIRPPGQHDRLHHRLDGTPPTSPVTSPRASRLAALPATDGAQLPGVGSPTAAKGRNSVTTAKAPPRMIRGGAFLLHLTSLFKFHYCTGEPGGTSFIGFSITGI